MPENVARARKGKFSDQQGKNRELRRNRTSGPDLSGKKLKFYAGLWPNSLFDRNREIFSQNRDFDREEQGLEVFSSAALIFPAMDAI